MDHTAGCEAYSFTKDGYGIFNVRTLDIWVRAVQEDSGTNRSAQELTRRDRKTAPARESNPGSSDLNSVALTTELRPPPPPTPPVVVRVCGCMHGEITDLKING